jgi:predicted thioredoxin/glutaredoxin
VIHPGPSTPLRDLVVMVRQGCHLCEQFMLELSLELGPAFEQVRIVDVDTDPELALRYGLRVPVLEVDGRLVCEGVLDPAKAGAALKL